MTILELQGQALGLSELLSSLPYLATIVVIACLDALKVPGSILIGVLLVTFAAILTGVSQFGGLVSTPPSIAPTFLQLDVLGALHGGIFHVVLVMVLVGVFDATGTLIGIARRAGLLLRAARTLMSGSAAR